MLGEAARGLDLARQETASKESIERPNKAAVHFIFDAANLAIQTRMIRKPANPGILHTYIFTVIHIVVVFSTFYRLLLWAVPVPTYFGPCAVLRFRLL